MAHLVINAYPISLVFMAIALCIAITIDAYYRLMIEVFN